MARLRSKGSHEIERLKDLITAQLSAKGSLQPVLILSLGCLAHLRQRHHQYAKAERLYRRALELYDLLPQANLPVLSALLDAYLELLAETGRVADAVRVVEWQSRLLERDEPVDGWRWQAVQAGSAN